MNYQNGIIMKKAFVGICAMLSVAAALAGPALPAVPLAGAATPRSILKVKTLQSDVAESPENQTCWSYVKARSAVSLATLSPSAKVLAVKTGCSTETSVRYMQRMEADGVVIREGTGWRLFDGSLVYTCE